MEGKQHAKPQDALSKAVMEDGRVPIVQKKKKTKKKIIIGKTQNPPAIIYCFN